jgi:diphthamide synthase (EF-2-diphthine--ammonia ligase)
MTAFMEQARAAGVECMAFGDLYLEDVRRYREERLLGTGITPVFPLWGRPTRALLDEMLGCGLRACLICVDPRVLPAAFAGRELTPALLAELPTGIDPCGENGEFHSFVIDGPLFREPVRFTSGELVSRGPFWFRDLVPVPAGAPAAA